VDLSIAPAEFLVVLGTSGSGKSTLLRVIAGLDHLDSGTIEWNDSEAGERPHTGVVFQQPLLMPWLTVRENIAFGGRFAANRQRFDVSYADDLVERFGLSAVAHSYPDQLSGGQAQRVAVIRAVSIRPRLLLLDEPFSALDPAIRGDLQQWLGDLATELGFTAVLVTHDIDEAITLGSRIALLGRDGKFHREWNAPGDTDGLRSEILSEYRDAALVTA
jgi:sulfate transport system ATP-binding protein/sulfonate transport system ATP-binding protein